MIVELPTYAPGLISATEAEEMLKQAFMAAAGKGLAAIGKSTLGHFNRGWGWAGRHVGNALGGKAPVGVSRAIQTGENMTLGAGNTAARSATSASAPFTGNIAPLKAPMTFGSAPAGNLATTAASTTTAVNPAVVGQNAVQKMTQQATRLQNFGQGQINTANTSLRSIGAGEGATTAERVTGKVMRGLGGATNLTGWKGVAAGMGSVPMLAAWGYTPGSWAVNQAFKAPDWVAGQQMQGAGRAMAEFANRPMYERLGAAFSPGAMEQRLQGMDPRIYQSYQQYRA